MRTCLLAVGLFSFFQARASHIVGAEIRYECIGNDEYIITLDVYRDCGDINNEGFDDPAFLAAFTADGTYISEMNEFLTMHPVFTDTLPNNISNDPCLLPPPNVCVQTARYRGTVTLTRPGGIYIVYQRCCRNATITNIEDPEFTGSTYFVYISPESRAICNSSPEFGFYPPIFVCVNKPIEHDHAATDMDGDSLVYKLYTPFTGATFSEPNPPGAGVTPPPYDTVTWIDPPYNLDNVLGPSSIANLSIDPQTGLITGYPEIMGQFVVGVSVEEYRNGILLSVVRRDFQYNVGECVQVTAEIVADTVQCDDLTVEFGNATNGPENFLWYYVHGTDTVFFSNEFEPTFTFPDTGKYEILLIAEPGFECVDTASLPIFFQFNSLSADFNWQTFDCSTESVLALTDLSEDNVSPPSEWHWEVAFGDTVLVDSVQNPVFQLPNPASGTITLTVLSRNGCETITTQNFETGNNDPTDCLPDVVQICIGETAELNPVCDTEGFTFQWATPLVPPDQQNFPNPLVSPLLTTLYDVTITGLAGLCTTETSVTVEVSPAVVLDFEPDTDCDARVVHFVNQSQNAPAGYVWNFGDPSNPNAGSDQSEPTYTYPDYGTYTVTLMTAPDAICGDTITREITLTEKILNAAFDFDFVTCEVGIVAIEFFDISENSLGNTTGWQWEFSGVYNGTSTLPSPTVVVDQEGELNVTLTITTDENCVSATMSQSLQIDLTELPGLNESEVLGCLEQGVVLNPGGDASYSYQWFPATGLSCNGCPDPTTSPSPFANPTETTTYTVMIENISADTCFITREVTVNVPEDVGLIGSDDVLTCDPTATLSATTTSLGVTFNWFDENGGLVQAGSSSTTVDVSGYSDYTIRATDQFGCDYFDTVRVAGGPVNIETSGDQILCSDDPLDVFATNLDPNDTLTWQWSPAASFNGPTDVADPEIIVVPGNQTLTVFAENQFGCEATEEVEIDVVDVNNNLDFDFQVECNGSQVTFINTSTGAYNFFWDFGDPTTDGDTSHLDNPTYTYPATGAYPVTLTIDFDLDCITPIQKQVEIAETQFVVDFGFDYLNCSEDSILVQFFDETEFFVNNISVVNWLWELSNGQTSMEQNPIFTILPGEELDVSLSIETSNGCTGMYAEFIKFEFFNISLPDTLVVCPGDSVFLNPLGDVSYAYDWSPDVSISSTTAVNPQIWPAQTTVYSVEITNFAPDTCSVVREITVFVPEKINLSATGDDLSCGDPITLVASSPISPISYTWTADPGSIVGMEDTLIHDPFIDTEYEVLAIDQYGCRDSAQLSVAFEEVNVDLVGDGNDCPETEAVLKAVNNVDDHVLTFDWSSSPGGSVLSGSTDSVATILTPEAGQSTVFTVFLENQFACTDTLSIAVDAYAFVPTVLDSVKVCFNAPTEINPGANPNLNYEWSPADVLNMANSPNPTAVISETTVFSVIVSDGFGFDNCADTLDVLAFVPTPIEITGAVDTFTCGGPISLNATTNVPTEIEWQDENGTPQMTGNPFQVDPETEQVFIAVATDGFACVEADTFTVSNNQIDIVLDGGGVIDTCPQDNFIICVTNLDLNDMLTYEWEALSNGSIESGATEACPVITTLEGATANFAVTVTNQWGCTSEEEVDITTYSFDPVVREVTTICPNVPTEINPEAAGSGLTYMWSPATGLSCTDCPNPTATLSMSQQYLVTILGFNGADTCSFSQLLNVFVNPLIGVTTSPSPDTSLCEETDITLSANMQSPIGEEVCWYENTLDNLIGCGDEITVTPDATVNYFAVASDTLGCLDTASLTVNAYPIDVDLLEEYVFCEEAETLDIIATNNDPAQVLTYDWLPQNFIIDAAADNSRITIDDVPPVQVFTVAIENQFGCKLTDSTTVLYFNIDPTIGEITASRDSIYFNSGEFSQLEIDDIDGYFYNWIPPDGLDDPSSPTPIATPSETTEYLLIITNEFGCSAERMDSIIVLNPDCGEPDIFIPNAFTPNGDGENDVLYVRGNIIETMELAIYDRWGEEVFRTEDQSEGWDGRFKNELLGPDVYGFYLKAKCFNGMEFFKKGNVMILR